jgi:quercetin dioxygenase-like cupin family protein
MSGFALGPGEGAAFGFHGAAVVMKASGVRTGGQLAVMESVYPAGLAVAEHVHAGEDEMFFLLAGGLTVFCGDDSWSARAGSFVFIPRDHPHGFTVSAAGPARALVITGPPRLDQQIATRGEAVPEWLGKDAGWTV